MCDISHTDTLTQNLQLKHSDLHGRNRKPFTPFISLHRLYIFYVLGVTCLDHPTLLFSFFMLYNYYYLCLIVANPVIIKLSGQEKVKCVKVKAAHNNYMKLWAINLNFTGNFFFFFLLYWWIVEICNSIFLLFHHLFLFCFIANRR